MKASLRWLKKHIPIEIKKGSIKELVEKLTMLGLEVDSVFDRFDYLKKILIGKIEKIKNINKYFLYSINCGKSIIKIISSVKDLSVGMLLPVAIAGTVLPNGVVRKKKIHGYYSDGIFCNEDSLQISENSSKIIAFEGNYTPGSNLKDILNISDLIIDLSLTPNRSDCASIIGIAREISTIIKLNIYNEKIKFADINSKKINNLVAINISETKKCLKYSLKMFEDVKIKKSPFWLQNYLISIGVSPINNIVDITNFVMFETGQPLHAYDYDSIKKGKINIYSSKQNEKITTLNNRTKNIPKGTLLIYDAKKPIAIAGVIGCNKSKISKKTKKILVESAYFEPSTVRKITKNLGINTDSSYRFERGTDPNGINRALNRFSSIIKILINTVADCGIINYDFTTNSEKSIELNVNNVISMLGIHLSIFKIKKILNSIGFLVEESHEMKIKVRVPSYRVDVKIPEDLIEEIARIYGYDMIPIKYPKIEIIANQNVVEENKINLFKSSLKSIGFSEIITYSFIDKTVFNYLNILPEDYRKNYLEIVNPISSNHSIMRTSMIPGILDTISKNNSKKINNLRLFEIGKIFLSNGLNNLPKEVDFIIAILSGKIENSYWKNLNRKHDFFDMKGYVEIFLESLQLYNFEFTKIQNEKFYYMKEGYSAKIICYENPLGFIWEFNKEVLEKFSIKEPVFAFEINVEILNKCFKKYKKIKSIPKFPSISRDTTLILDREIDVGIIFKELENINENFLESFYLLDIFYEKTSKKLKKSITFKIIYRSKNETLNDKIVNLIHKRIVEKLVSKFKAELP